MLYTVTTDDNGYILSISHTKEDSIELDLKEMDLRYLGAYQLSKGVVTLDEAVKKELEDEMKHEADQERIEELKMYLKSTDGIMAEMIEDMLSLNNPVTFIADLIKLMADYSTRYKDVIAQRKEARREIDEKEK